MRRAHSNILALAALGGTVLFIAGCHAPGMPGPAEERPEQVRDFNVLYKQNCAGCHGEQGRSGIAVSLANPVYIAIAGKDAIAEATAKGGPGALMPAFAKSHGGFLTDQQVDVVADGIVRRWGQPSMLNGLTPPSYVATLSGDAVAGKTAFESYCARCHRSADAAPTTEIKGQPRNVGSLTDADFLALISDQNLRSTIIAGKPDEGMPDWRGFGPQPLSDRQVTDIVAWLSSQRKKTVDPSRQAQIELQGVKP
jgi:cytochrome c oxidase cbb3-type subunit 3/ubiquinol-cytochrome c reductase cytochrome c subunit